MAGELLVARELTKWFPMGPRSLLARRRKMVHAVERVDLRLVPGETLCVVGESGSGKTTLANLILRIERPTRGAIFFEDRDIWRLSAESLRRYRGMVQAVLQDPASSLSPRMRVRDIIAEPLVVGGGHSKAEMERRVSELMEQVGLDPTMAGNYPHEFSGGQRQRIAIARALAPKPRLIILDEPVSSLDVSIAAQIINLLKDLQAQVQVAYLLISHNLATVRYLGDRVLVMYLGEVVESGTIDQVFGSPAHPYTRALLESAVPHGPPSERDQKLLLGEVLVPTSQPTDCRFHTRCPLAFGRCLVESPVLRTLADDGHAAACHLA